MIFVWDSYNKATGWQAYDAVTSYLAFHAGEGGTAPPVVVTATTVTPGGVRRSRFLRRGPKLPWEEDEIQDAPVTVTEVRKRKRIKLPKEIIEAVDGIPIQVSVEVPELRINVPSVGSAILRAPDDEEEAILMALLQ